MRIWAIARITFSGFLRNKILILFSAIFLCVLLLFLGPVLFMRTQANGNPSSAEVSPIIYLIGGIVSLISGFGSLMAAWSAADTVAGEMKSGTILAVMARPVRRWEFLLGKYLGVQMLMAIYVIFMLALSYLLAWIGGDHIHASPWVLIVYPLCRFAIYSALAMFLVTFMHSLVAFGSVLVVSILAYLFQPGGDSLSFLPGPVKTVAYIVLPSTGLLSEERFLVFDKASLEKITWNVHAITLAYGLDYALICFLLAVWSFQRRNLSRD